MLTTAVIVASPRPQDTVDSLLLMAHRFEAGVLTARCLAFIDGQLKPLEAPPPQPQQASFSSSAATLLVARLASTSLKAELPQLYERCLRILARAVCGEDWRALTSLLAQLPVESVLLLLELQEHVNGGEKEIAFLLEAGEAVAKFVQREKFTFATPPRPSSCGMCGHKCCFKFDVAAHEYRCLNCRRAHETCSACSCRSGQSGQRLDQLRTDVIALAERHGKC